MGGGVAGARQEMSCVMVRLVLGSLRRVGVTGHPEPRGDEMVTRRDMPELIPVQV